MAELNNVSYCIKLGLTGNLALEDLLHAVNQLGGVFIDGQWREDPISKVHKFQLIVENISDQDLTVLRLVHRSIESIVQLDAHSRAAR